MVQEQTIFGVPIPLRYITPNLNFYPLIFPSNIIYISTKIENNHLNDARLNIKLNNKDHLYFIQLLMKKLNRNFIIIGKYLIDLTRKDYLLRIDKDEIFIQNYFQSQRYRYVTEKFFHKNNITFSQIKKCNNNIEEHCERIVSGTKLIQSCFSQDILLINNLEMFSFKCTT